MSDPLLYAIVDEVGGVCDDGESLLVSTNRDELADDAHYMNRGAYEDCAVCVVPLYAHPPAALPEPDFFSNQEDIRLAKIDAVKEGSTVIAVSLQEDEHFSAPLYAAAPARPALPDGWLSKALSLVDRYVSASIRSETSDGGNGGRLDRATDAALDDLLAHLKRAAP